MRKTLVILMLRAILIIWSRLVITTAAPDAFKEDDNNNQLNVFQFGNEDKYLNASQLITKYGYKAEEHYVTTEDGYVLLLQRLRGAGGGAGGDRGVRVAFLMHGLVCSADDWLTGGPGRALPYLLAAAGYDVWLGNARGNKYSRRHVTLSPRERRFWEFSWHEIGVSDLPAMIDHALRTSGAADLLYVGHSQGTTVFYVLCSEKPAYNAKISLSFSLATVAYTGRASSPLVKSMASVRQLAAAAMFHLGLYEVLPSDAVTRFVTSVLCDMTRAAQLLCSTVIFNLVGFDYAQIDYERFSAQISHFPAGSSYRQMAHYSQNGESGRFAKYDFGAEMNLRVYGAESPPEYAVERVTAAVAAVLADNDALSSAQNTARLTARLPNVVSVFRVPYAAFNHLDYFWAKDVKELLYSRMFEIIEEHIAKTNLVLE